MRVEILGRTLNECTNLRHEMYATRSMLLRVFNAAGVGFEPGEQKPFTFKPLRVDGERLKLDNGLWLANIPKGGIARVEVRTRGCGVDLIDGINRVAGSPGGTLRVGRCVIELSGARVLSSGGGLDLGGSPRATIRVLSPAFVNAGGKRFSRGSRRVVPTVPFPVARYVYERAITRARRDGVELDPAINSVPPLVSVAGAARAENVSVEWVKGRTMERIRREAFLGDVTYEFAGCEELLPLFEEATSLLLSYGVGSKPSQGFGYCDAQGSSF